MSDALEASAEDMSSIIQHEMSEDDVLAIKDKRQETGPYLAQRCKDNTDMQEMHATKGEVSYTSLKKAQTKRLKYIPPEDRIPSKSLEAAQIDPKLLKTHRVAVGESEGDGACFLNSLWKIMQYNKQIESGRLENDESKFAFICKLNKSYVILL